MPGKIRNPYGHVANRGVQKNNTNHRAGAQSIHEVNPLGSRRQRRDRLAFNCERTYLKNNALFGIDPTPTLAGRQTDFLACGDRVSLAKHRIIFTLAGPLNFFERLLGVFLAKHGVVFPLGFAAHFLLGHFGMASFSHRGLILFLGRNLFLYHQ